MPDVFAVIWEWVLAWTVGGALTFVYVVLVLAAVYLLALVVLAILEAKRLMARWKGGA